MSLRNSLLTLSCAASITCVEAQTITVSFAGEWFGGPWPLDSVRVMNLTQGGDTVLHAPDTLLLLSVSTSITGQVPGSSPGLSMRSPIPNPFEESSLLHVSVAGSGELDLKVVDALGEPVAMLRRKVGAGVHAFSYSGGPAGILHVVAHWNGEYCTQQLVHAPGAMGGGRLRHVGTSTYREEGEPKSGGFVWQAGDVLRYLGYATDAYGRLSSSIDASPSATTHETFILDRGIVCPATPTMSDLDGNSYRTVQIGDQCWMAGNLRTSTYANGDPIDNVTDGSTWVSLTTGAWTNYSNDASYGNILGKLYNWYAVTDARNVCPSGWHAPTDLEWQTLEAELGMPVAELNSTGYRGAVENVGGKLKAGLGTTGGFMLPNNTASDEFGFRGLGGGTRSSVFSGAFYYGHYWSTTEIDANLAWYRLLSFDNGAVGRPSGNGAKRSGFSVRCLRD